MEEECHLLDLAIVSEDSIDEGGSSWGHFVEEHKRAESLRVELQRCKQYTLLQVSMYTQHVNDVGYRRKLTTLMIQYPCSQSLGQVMRMRMRQRILNYRVSAQS